VVVCGAARRDAGPFKQTSARSFVGGGA
jgi:hypothetical protein